jgi:hypothetical protein
LSTGAAVDVGVTSQPQDKGQSDKSLLLTVLVPSTQSRVFFRPTLYHVGDHDPVNPTDPSLALVFLMQYSGPVHVCEGKDFARIVTRLPYNLAAISFIGHSWSHWHCRQYPNRPINLSEIGPPWRDGFDGIVKLCVESNLSEPHLLFLLAGAGLYEQPECFLFEFRSEQHVACLFDSAKPGVYVLQLVSGRAALQVFLKIATRNHFRLIKVANHADSLRHLPLLEFLGQALIADAARQSSQGIIF